MNKAGFSPFSLIFCGILMLGTTVSAQEFDFPGEDEDGGGQCEEIEITVIGAALTAFTAQTEAKCECDPEHLATYKKCLEKLSKKGLNAFKAAAKYNQEPFSELRSAFSEEIDALVSDCEGSGDDGEEDPSDDGDFEE